MANRQDAQPSKASAAMRGSTFMPAPSRNFDRDLSALAVLKGARCRRLIRRLREQALKDEKRDMLDNALKTVASPNESVCR